MPPTGIRTATLTRMRANALKLLPDTCTIRQSTLISDGAGGKTIGWTSYTGEPVALDALSADKAASLGLNVKMVTYDATFRYDAPLVAGSQVDHNGHTYEVWSILDDETPTINRKAILIRIA